MRILFVGDCWAGSSARGLREALGEVEDVEIDEVGTDLIVPIFRSRVLRTLNKLLAPLEIRELKRQIVRSCRNTRPDVIVVFKGWHLDADFISQLRQEFAPVVNIFPDASPHAHGARLRRAMGTYDLVISTKSYHPPLWKTVYGYENQCVHVGHGYVPAIHLRHDLPVDPTYDLVLAARGRPEYVALLRDALNRLPGRTLRVAIVGDNWKPRDFEGCSGVELIGARMGKSYTDWLRRGKIIVAPVQSVVQVGSDAQPGDEVSTRTFECAAAYVFFIHQRTNEVTSYYDEVTEVPMYADAAELAQKIEFFLKREETRSAMATAAHRRAVPAYSTVERGVQIADLLREFVKQRADGRSDESIGNVASYA